MAQMRLVTISVECAFNHLAPYAMYCFCCLSGLTWIAWVCIAAYGKCALIRIGNQPPLGMAENRITVSYIELKATRIKLTL